MLSLTKFQKPNLGNLIADRLSGTTRQKPNLGFWGNPRDSEVGIKSDRRFDTLVGRLKAIPGEDYFE
ncbi:hypothetical protein THAOC_08312 [Thalassiosira oceanica]|uniref:Uncharacterized protein n=1 Tax=Thalassiosira oceanica TaxID=159749 RepID=K0SZA9_THAOC|nr:hypothetical protein THAOC_08312 [Thalassiosira oceanica]|eukprot:EJK70334.1 hypothetical protein THAOC_08312 [Thalassiosira oceanica]